MKFNNFFFYFFFSETTNISNLDFKKIKNDVIEQIKKGCELYFDQTITDISVKGIIKEEFEKMKISNNNNDK